MNTIEDINRQPFDILNNYAVFDRLGQLDNPGDIELVVGVENAVKKLEPGINKLLKSTDKFGIAVAITKRGKDFPIVVGSFGLFENPCEAKAIAEARAYDLKGRSEDNAQGVFAGRAGRIISVATNNPDLDNSVALAICIGAKILTVDQAEEIAEKINDRKFMENEDTFTLPFFG